MKIKSQIYLYSFICLFLASYIFISNKNWFYPNIPYSLFLSEHNNLRTVSPQIDYLKVMTYNVRFDFLDYNKQSWAYRKEKFVNNINMKTPDIICFQEDTFGQLSYINTHWTQNTYTDIGITEDLPVNSHYNSIFYNKHKYISLYNETIWWNEHNKVNEVGWDGWFPRSATIAWFKDVKHGNEFLIANVHLDHKGRVARLRGMEMVLKKIDTIQMGRNLPVFLMGDFNESPRQLVFKKVIENNYIDVWNKCRSSFGDGCDFGEQFVSSFHWYTGRFVNNFFIRNWLHIIFFIHSGKRFPQYNRYHIDHMFFSNGKDVRIKPMYMSMPSDDLYVDKSGIYASDHFPLFAVFQMNSEFHN